jgi:hypothetical protein
MPDRVAFFSAPGPVSMGLGAQTLPNQASGSPEGSAEAAGDQRPRPAAERVAVNTATLLKVR